MQSNQLTASQALREMEGMKPGALNLAYCSRVKGWTLEAVGRNGNTWRRRDGVVFVSAQDFVAEMGRDRVMSEVLATFDV